MRITFEGASGTVYMVGDDGYLVPAFSIAGNAWYALYSEQTTFGYLGANSTTINEGYLGDNDSAVTVWITGVSSVTGTNIYNATATLASGVAVSDVTVTGSSAGSLELTIDGTQYFVSDNKLVERYTTVNGPQWLDNRDFYSYTGWVYLPAGASTTFDNKDGHFNITSTPAIWITNVRNVTGDGTAVTATLASGASISNVEVTGSGADAKELILTIDGVVYYVKNKKLTALYSTINGAQWRNGGNNIWAYLPAGASATLNNKTGVLTSTSMTTIQISNVSYAGGSGTSVDITLASDVAVSDVTVTGDTANLFVLIGGAVNGTYYFVSDNKLVEVYTTVNGPQWLDNRNGDGKWRYLPTGASATFDNKNGYLKSTSATTLQITNVSNVTGDNTAATATLASGVAVSDVTVTGSGAGYLTLTIDDTEYTVSNNKLVAYAITISGAQWRNATPSGTAQWVYLPAGAVAKVNANSGDMDSTSTTTLQLTCVSNVTGDDSAATATLAANATFGDVIVTGSAAGAVVITIGGVNYRVDANGRLIEIISGNAWYELTGANGVWGWLSADSLTRVSGHLSDANDSAVTIWIDGANSVAGNATAAVAILASGVAISDVTVTGSAAGGLTLTIGNAEYMVDANGKLIKTAVIITGARWINLQEDSTPYGVAYLPEGETIRSADENFWAGESGEEDPAFSVIIVGGKLYNSPQTEPLAVTLELFEGNAASDITVTDAPQGLTVSLMEPVSYLVDISGKLVSAAATPAKTKIVNRIKKKNGRVTNQQLSYINPAANDDQLSTFMNALNSLTTNTSTGIYRIDQHDL